VSNRLGNARISLAPSDIYCEMRRLRRDTCHEATFEAQRLRLNPRYLTDSIIGSLDEVFGLVIDTSITWGDTLRIADPRGGTTNISSSPETGMNDVLRDIGRHYGVIKHKTDRPHWSIDGR
jgi:hypothetical protein